MRFEKTVLEKLGEGVVLGIGLLGGLGCAAFPAAEIKNIIRIVVWSTLVVTFAFEWLKKCNRDRTLVTSSPPGYLLPFLASQSYRALDRSILQGELLGPPPSSTLKIMAAF